MKTLEELLNEGHEILKNKNIIDAYLDAWYLLTEVFNITKVEYLLNKTRIIEDSKYIMYKELINKRSRNVPLSYILGHTEFMGLNFIVNENVLIPRQDTETLVEEVFKIAYNKHILDMCTGSGCIIISLLKLTGAYSGVGVDISSEALKVANYNSELNKIDNLKLIRSDLFEKVEEKFDIIVSNPPYIESGEIIGLMPEVRDYEPLIALDGKEDGLYFYKKIINEARDYLKTNGRIYFEIGYNQGKSVSDILAKHSFKDINIVKDLAGLDRVIYASI